jgi:hypothetical protein
MEWYEGHLEAHPVLTKMCTGSLLWGIGDAVAQVVPQVAFTEEPKKDASDSSSSSSSTKITTTTTATTTQKLSCPFTYDWPRTGRAALFGFALHAPTSHVHFNFLEWLTHRVGVTGSFGIPIFKAFMEQFVYWSWISNSMYHGAMGAMQGMSMQQIYDRIADVLWETQKAQVKYCNQYHFVCSKATVSIFCLLTFTAAALIDFYFIFLLILLVG